ncbi:MAG: extracellular solute-binding protein [Christensenellaceae bacterium]|nr:extracellular solute-binding protein [Christensenellaceae bacterium]MEA5065603.1 extracellular solute-binding protein [Eubacteriales bacterium]MEA5069619.1 extracellular solute-binding protein [Christensenellaceae bacterium]
MKKSLSMLLALVLVLGLFTALPALAQEKVTLTFFHRWPNEPKGPYMDQVVAAFEAANPNIDIVLIDPVLNDSYKEKIRVLVGSSEIPDVFMSWSGSFGRNLVKSGRVLALDDMIAADPDWAAQITESQWGPFNYDGKQYGIPWSMDGKVFFYNKTEFDRLGLAEPNTWDEFIAVLDALKAAGHERPLSEGFSAEWAVSHYMGTLVQRMVDPAVVAKDYALEGDFSDPGYIAMLNRFADLKQYMTEDPCSVDHTYARNAFIDQEGMLCYMQLAEIKYLADGADFEYSFFDMPALPDGKGDPDELTGAPEGMMISAECKHPEAAQAFVKFFINQENGSLMTKMTGELSCVKGAVNAQTVSSPKQLEAVELILKSSGTTLWQDNALDATVASAFMKGGQLLLTGDMTPEQVMEGVQVAAKEAASK